MSDVVVIETVTQAAQMYTGKMPDHPLIHVVDLSETCIESRFLNTRICSNFYSLVMKQGVCGQVMYGRNHYDFSSGLINAYGPGQVVQIEQPYKPGDLTGWALMFHPDLLLQHPLNDTIKQYGFFSYEVFEALHLSDREKQIVGQVIEELVCELQQNQDEFSLDIILARLDLLLKYTNRYFNRQFLTRRPFYRDSVERFKRILDEHLSQSSEFKSGLPTVNQLAAEMKMSPNYMSDFLRKETGKTAQELIHYRLIEKAKYLLLNTDSSVATIAYQLGFEYPQYFSRIFKKKTTVSPQDFRKLH